MNKLPIFLLMILVLSVGAFAVPKLNGYVTDNANILNPTEIQQLNERITHIEKNTSVEIAIVTVPDTEGDSKDNYAIMIGQENGVGKKADDNGVVILWSVGNQHGGFIATGRGIESVLTDAEVGMIGRSARPLFDQGAYAAGFNKILDGIDDQLHKEYTSATTSTQEPPDGGIIVIAVILGLFFIIIIAVATETEGSSGGSSGGSWGGSSYVSRGGFSSGFSSGGRSGGFSGFGGGGFGGGGGGF